MDLEGLLNGREVSRRLNSSGLLANQQIKLNFVTLLCLSEEQISLVNTVKVVMEKQK